MNSKTTLLHSPVCQGYCFLTFTGLLTSAFFGAGLLRVASPLLFQITLIVLGFFGWTFFEYVLHRFWMHRKHGYVEGGNDIFNHQHHHTHPTDMWINGRHRAVALLVTTALVTAGLLMNNYFSFISGFFVGLIIYTNMHWALHQSWGRDFFPGLQQQHIQHHLKYTDLCFGVTTTAWDRVFRTTAPKHAVITDKVYRFYIEGPSKISRERMRAQERSQS